ncbi:hypothetical protein AMJ83_03575 [candidate division WOR_3 bacterium SM23_42]|uniref:Apolipoprotein N-acyltransferase n=1 Tax=candidate division WOR_3 bacterium SM23_42 TaxID=1703779 RepID=A0A0S8FWI8_UNCW3|nr:MAG: hypothetical protein AMJ83_03575 [candidate division WOR_3 bacterium SM23_42]
MFRYRDYLLLAVAALLMSLSFHPIKLHFLAWFGLVPMLLVIEDVRPGQSFRAGLIFGFLFALFTLFWIVFLQIEVNIKLLMTLGLIVLFLYVGLYYGTTLLIINKTNIWMLPFAVTGLEFIRGIGELGFPWLTLGYTQARYPLFIQQAAIYGVYGISFWLVLLNVLIYRAVKNTNAKNILLAVLVFALPILYGIVRQEPSYKRRVSVGIVQPNIDPNMKFSSELRYETFRRLVNLSTECANASWRENADSLDIIVWPETATPVFLKSPGTYQDLIVQLVNRLRVPIFTGTAIYERRNHEIYNGAVLIEPNRGINQEYRKIHLVPFGEHIPFDRHIAFLRKVDFGEGDYSPGTSLTVFETEKFKFACLICFESIFPELCRRFVHEGADILINITNDGWFGKISGAQQHNNMAILRSVENGVVLLRSANTGISMIVDQFGRVRVERPLFIEDIIVFSLDIDPINTFYRRLGDLLPMISLMLVTVFVARSYILKRRK